MLNAAPRRRVRSHRLNATRIEVLESRNLLATTPFNIDDFASLPATVDVGLGSLTTVLPASEDGPNAAPNYTSDFQGPVAAAEWWSSIAYPSAGVSFPIFTHPFASLHQDDGLAVGYARDAIASENSYNYAYDEDLHIGLAGFATSGAQVSGYSDWTVTSRWENGADRLEVTMGHGLPFVYATRTGSLDAEIDFDGAVSVWSNADGVVGVTIGSKHYGLFAPTGSSWTLSGNSMRSDLNGQDYFSVAVLPDNSQATLDFYRARAFAFVTDTQVSWNYDEANAASIATYAAMIEQQETGGVNVDEAVMALYRHQWLNTADPLTAYAYQSPRGEMKVLSGDSFTTTLSHTGVLPVLPELGSDPTQLWGYIDDLYQQPNLLPTTDTYFTGTNIYKLAQLIPLAEQIGHLEARERFLFEVRSELEDWFSATDDGEGQFQYDEQWNTLIGYPDSFGSADSLNDHHFHYGYFIQSAAIVAMYDPEWAEEDAWGGMVELLIRDVASWERDDSTFQFLRNFDIYAGHSWASGNANFGRGNNQESSSEAMSFSNGLIHWGSVTGDEAIRDLGVYLSTTQQAAIEQYWLDVDDVVFPEDYDHPIAGIVWSDGVDYATFFSGEPELIQGINYLPLNGGSLYLGHDPAYVQAGYDHIVSENGGVPDDWKDLVYSYLAFADPTTALAAFNADPTDEIQPLAKNLHWISSLGSLGHVDPSVTADLATYAVFDKAGAKSYVAYNPSDTEVTATYSDGTLVTVPAGTMVVSGANTFSWAPNPGLQPAVPENRLYVRDQESATATATLGRVAGTGVASDGLTGPDGDVFFNTPNNPVVYTAAGISGIYEATKVTSFQVYLDAFANAGNMVQARVSYDLEGDGLFDRFEVYTGYPTDASTGWELYSQDQGVVETSGALADMSGGTVRLEVWNVFGPGGVETRTDASVGEGLQSFLDLPFTDVTQSPLLEVALAQSTISENGGTTTVTVSLAESTAVPVEVTLSSNDTGEAVVVAPTTRTIAIGQDSITFTINAVDDAVFDGTQTVTLTAMAAGFADGAVQLSVTDDEVPAETSRTFYLIDGAVASATVGMLDIEAGTAAASDLVPEGSGGVGTPSNPLVYVVDGLNGAYNQNGETEFDFYLDAGSNVGSATQARVSYDFDGDSVFDRIETFNFYATDPVVGWERYQQGAGISNESGSFTNLVNGTVKLELWKGFGTGNVQVRTSATEAEGQQSLLTIPFIALVLVPGDANGDGSVDLLDLDILGSNFGLTPAALSQGDFNGDNVVDLLDLDILGSNFGTTASADTVAAPAIVIEPAIEPSIDAAFASLSLGRPSSNEGPTVTRQVLSVRSAEDNDLLLLAPGYAPQSDAYAETYDRALLEESDEEEPQDKDPWNVSVRVAR